MVIKRQFSASYSGYVNAAKVENTRGIRAYEMSKDAIQFNLAAAGPCGCSCVCPCLCSSSSACPCGCQCGVMPGSIEEESI